MLMRKTFRLVTVSLAIVLVTLVAMAQRVEVTPQTPPPSMPTGSGLVEGVVLQTDNQQAIAGVTVRFRLIGPRGTPEITTTTDSAGRFAFRNVPLTGYQLNAERIGYFATGVNGERGTPGIMVVGNLTDAKSSANVMLYLMPGASVSGRVLDSNGQPAPRIEVQALSRRAQFGEMGLVLGSRAATATTDDRGNYRIWGLTTGDYYIRAETPQLLLLRSANAPIPTYYPSAATPATALPVRLTSGREESADIRLLQLRPIKISGRIVATPPTQGSCNFFLLPADKTSGYVAENIDALKVPVPVSRPEGTFQIQTYVPGTYDLYCMMRPRLAARGGSTTGDAPYLIGKTRVDVFSADIEGVTISLTLGQFVEARITTGGIPELEEQIPPKLTLLPRQPISQPINVGFGLRGGDPRATSRPTRGEPVQRSATRIPEGEYVLAPVLTGLKNAYISDIRQAGVSILEHGTVRVGAEPPPPIEIVLEQGGGSVQGRITGAPGPTKPVYTYLVPEGSRQTNFILYKRTATTNGQFTLGAITPGSYRLYAFAENPDGLEYVREFLQKHATSSRQVTVTRGASVTGVSLPLIPDLLR
jgi:hypothetical protein